MLLNCKRCEYTGHVSLPGFRFGPCPDCDGSGDTRTRLANEALRLIRQHIGLEIDAPVDAELAIDTLRTIRQQAKSWRILRRMVVQLECDQTQ